MAADTQVHPFPPKIAASIVTVMAALGTLGKEHERNDPGARYEYASIDDFIEHVRHHMAEAGLFIVPNEAREPEMQEVLKRDGKPTVVWNARFAFYLGHTSGEGYGPIYKTVIVPANGAQAAGSAQSYAEKQLLRGLFKIPTGDKDDPDKSGIDISSKGDTESDLQKKANSIRKKLRAAKDINELGLAWSDNAIDLDFIAKASETAHGFLKKEYDAKKLELENA